MGKSCLTRRHCFPALLAFCVLPKLLTGQEAVGGVSRFELDRGWTRIQSSVRASTPLSDQGRRAAVIGRETGSFEVWTWPVRLVQDMRLAFQPVGSAELFEGSTVARSVVRRPEGFTIVYSHPGFTVRQHVFVPLNEPGAIVLLDVQSDRPLDVLVRLSPDADFTAPARFASASIRWQDHQNRFLLSRGGSRPYSGLIGSPFAVNGRAEPVQGAPLLPSAFTLRFDSATARHDFIPILVAGGAASDSVAAVYDRLLERAAEYWREKVSHYRRLHEDRLSIGSPDSLLNDAFEWAKISLDRQLACDPALGCGLRAGFGWYFGADAVLNTFALDGLGQYAIVRNALEFFARIQRVDGSIPYGIAYAAAGLPGLAGTLHTFLEAAATPWWLLAVYEHWLATGDTRLLRELWPNITRAFAWSAGRDTDGDGLIEIPLAGVGAMVPSGFGADLRSDVFHTGAWAAAMRGTAEMARRVDDYQLAARADSIFQVAQQSLENFRGDSADSLSSGVLPSGMDAMRGASVVKPRLDAGIWPATALAFGLLDDVRARRVLREVGSSTTAAWLPRAGSGTNIFQPFRQNSHATDRPFAALAHYRYHRGWAGYLAIRELANGSASMATPLLRGLIGFSADVPNRAISLEPHLPAQWDSLAVSGLRLGSSKLDAVIRRQPGQYSMELRRTGGTGSVFLRAAPALPLGARVQRIMVDDRDVPVQAEESLHDVHATVELSFAEEATITIEYDDGVEIVTPAERARTGEEPALKVLDFTRGTRAGEYVIEVEGVRDRLYRLELRANQRLAAATGARITSQNDGRVVLSVRIPAGPGMFGRHVIRVRG